jgi:hypothetical protein
MEYSQRITCGHKTLGAKWLFEPWFSYQSLLHLDSEVATNSPNDFIRVPRSSDRHLLYNKFSLHAVIEMVESPNWADDPPQAM